MIFTPISVAEAVCAVLPGSSPAAILANHRGTPRTADLRAVAMMVWAGTHDIWPTNTAIGIAFGRDRRNVVRGMDRIIKRGIPTKAEYEAIARHLTILG